MKHFLQNNTTILNEKDKIKLPTSFLIVHKLPVNTCVNSAFLLVYPLQPIVLGCAFYGDYFPVEFMDHSAGCSLFMQIYMAKSAATDNIRWRCR